MYFCNLHLIHCCCMNELKKKTTHNIFLNPKALDPIFSATGWKKQPGPEVTIVVRNNCDTNLKIQLDI